MKFVDFQTPGAPDVLKISEMPTPKPGAGEVLIKVAAAGVNRPDLMQRQGKYPPPPDASPILGLEVAGTIESLGTGVSEFQIGDQVCALAPGGGYAEYCVVPAGQCLSIPKGISLEEAAAIPETFFTVWANVFQIGKLRAGEKLLVHGGSSGIGTTAIQLAHAFGTEIYATAGTDEKCKACVALGANAAINYKSQDFVAEIARLTGKTGVNVILDMIGGPYTPRNIECLATEGRLVQIAVQQGSEVTLSLHRLMSKRAILTGSTLRPRSIQDKARIASELRNQVWPLLENRTVRVQIDRVFNFDDVRAAHEYLEAGQHIGKIVLRLA